MLVVLGCTSYSFTVPVDSTLGSTSMRGTASADKRALALASQLEGRYSTIHGRSAVARRIFGLGTSEILVILGVAALVLGPEALKDFAKEAGKAAGDLKDVPKAFQDGMDTAQSEKAKLVEGEGATTPALKATPTPVAVEVK